MDTTKALRYADETDKSFGLAGMAIGLMAWDAEEWLEGIDIDAVGDEAMRMSAEYYLCTAPKIAAKAVWEQNLKRFQITAAMTVANVVCRELAHQRHSRIQTATDSTLRKLLTSEGAALCDLEDDEVSRVYGKSLAYCNRLFGHPGVCQLAEELADMLREKRALDAAKIWEILAPLNRL